jgi:acetylglutamate kinase
MSAASFFLVLILLVSYVRSFADNSRLSHRKPYSIAKRPSSQYHGQVMVLRMSSDIEVASLIEKVKTVVKKGSTIVIKYGGHAMENDDLRQGFCEDIGALCRIGIIPIVVHGGGPQIEKMLKSLNVESKFISGLRVTDKQTMDIAQMVLCGSINKDIVRTISNQPGVRGAIGLSGLDCNLIKAKLLQKSIVDPATGESKPVDLGLVGEPYEVNTSIIKDLVNLSLVPIIAPVGSGDTGQSLNINADTSAGAIAEALKVRLDHAIFAVYSIIHHSVFIGRSIIATD